MINKAQFLKKNVLNSEKAFVLVFSLMILMIQLLACKDPQTLKTLPKVHVREA